MTDVFLDPYDIWNPKWSPLDFNSFRWIVKPSKLSPNDGEFKVAVNVAEFTGTDDKLNVNILTENNQQLLCIQGEHVEDSGQCYTRKNLLKLYRLDGHCIPSSLCVFIADEVLIASVMVDGSTDKEATMVKSQNEIKQQNFRVKSDKHHVSSISTEVGEHQGFRKLSNSNNSSALMYSVETEEAGNVVKTATQEGHTASSAIGNAEPMRKDNFVRLQTQSYIPLNKQSNDEKATTNDARTSSESKTFQSATEVVWTIPQDTKSENYEVKFATQSEQFQTVPTTAKIEQASYGIASSNVIKTATESGQTERKLESSQNAGGLAKPVSPTLIQNSGIASKRATGDIMKLMSRFTGNTALINTTVEQKKQAAPNVKHVETSHLMKKGSMQATSPTFTSLEPLKNTCVVHEARRASVFSSIHPTVDEFVVQDNDVPIEEVDFTLKLPTTTKKQEDDVKVATESFSHPYEELEECELEQKFNDISFMDALNVDEKGQSLLRITLDLSEFRSDQLAMFIIGDDIVINIEILRLIGNSKTLTKKYRLPENADKSSLRSLLTAEGMLQIDVPLLKQDQSSEIKQQTISATEF